MKLMRISTVLAIMAASLSGAMLFSTSQKVHDADIQLKKLQAEQVKEREAIRVLRAEWDYLNRPDRLEALAKEHLGMQPPDIRTVMTGTAGLPDPRVPIIPARKPNFEGRTPLYREISQTSSPDSPSGAPAVPAAPIPTISETEPSLDFPDVMKKAAPEISDADRDQSRQSFQQLLNDLGTEEGAE